MYVQCVCNLHIYSVAVRMVPRDPGRWILSSFLARLAQYTLLRTFHGQKGLNPRNVYDSLGNVKSDSAEAISHERKKVGLSAMVFFYVLSQVSRHGFSFGSRRLFVSFLGLCELDFHSLGEPQAL